MGAADVGTTGDSAAGKSSNNELLDSTGDGAFGCVGAPPGCSFRTLLHAGHLMELAELLSRTCITFWQPGHLILFTVPPAGAC